MMRAAAKRTTQIRPARVSGMGEKANLAVNAGNDTTLQLGMRLDSRVQRHQILLDHRPGAIVLMPSRPKREELPDGDDKKAKFSATIPMSLHTPSSYLTEANASRGRTRFFSAPKQASPENRNQSPNPHRPYHPLRSRTVTRPPPGDLKRLLGKKERLSFFPSSGAFYLRKDGQLMLRGKGNWPKKRKKHRKTLQPTKKFDRSIVMLN